MNASELMTPNPVTCSSSTNLAQAARLMLDADCGILPVLVDGQLQGVVTDRDLFIALGTRDRRASSVTVGEVMQAPVFSCGPDDDVHAVLQLMKEHGVRRVPVEGFNKSLLGIVSMNDIVLAAGLKKGVRGGDVVDALQAICAHHFPAPRIEAA
jgi:CBS domain-containing protein